MGDELTENSDLIDEYWEKLKGITDETELGNALYEFLIKCRLLELECIEDENVDLALEFVLSGQKEYLNNCLTSIKQLTDDIFIREKSKTGIELISEERREQIIKHGFDYEHDQDEFHQRGELIEAAIFALTKSEIFYPKNWHHHFKYKLLDNKDLLHNYKVAGALIAAEIDRLKNN